LEEYERELKKRSKLQGITDEFGKLRKRARVKFRKRDSWVQKVTLLRGALEAV
jgi:hypothetical protein